MDQGRVVPCRSLGQRERHSPAQRSWLPGAAHQDTGRSFTAVPQPCSGAFASSANCRRGPAAGGPSPTTPVHAPGRRHPARIAGGGHRLPARRCAGFGHCPYPLRPAEARRAAGTGRLPGTAGYTPMALNRYQADSRGHRCRSRHWGIGEQLLRGTHHGGGLPRLADQRVQPRRVQVRLVVRVVAELVVVAVRPHHPRLAGGIERIGSARPSRRTHPGGDRPVAAVHRFDQARHVLRQPLVPPRRALMETVVRTRAVVAIGRRTTGHPRCAGAGSR